MQWIFRCGAALALAMAAGACAATVTTSTVRPDDDPEREADGPPIAAADESATVTPEPEDPIDEDDVEEDYVDEDTAVDDARRAVETLHMTAMPGQLASGYVHAVVGFVHVYRGATGEKTWLCEVGSDEDGGDEDGPCVEVPFAATDVAPDSHRNLPEGVQGSVISSTDEDEVPSRLHVLRLRHEDGTARRVVVRFAADGARWLEVGSVPWRDDGSERPTFYPEGASRCRGGLYVEPDCDAPPDERTSRRGIAELDRTARTRGRPADVTRLRDALPDPRVPTTRRVPGGGDATLRAWVVRATLGESAIVGTVCWTRAGRAGACTPPFVVERDDLAVREPRMVRTLPVAGAEAPAVLVTFETRGYGGAGAGSTASGELRLVAYREQDGAPLGALRTAGMTYTTEAVGLAFLADEGLSSACTEAFAALVLARSGVGRSRPTEGAVEDDEDEGEYAAPEEAQTYQRDLMRVWLPIESVRGSVVTIAAPVREHVAADGAFRRFRPAPDLYALARRLPACREDFAGQEPSAPPPSDDACSPACVGPACDACCALRVDEYARPADSEPFGPLPLAAPGAYRLTAEGLVRVD